MLIYEIEIKNTQGYNIKTTWYNLKCTRIYTTQYKLAKKQRKNAENRQTKQQSYIIHTKTKDIGYIYSQTTGPSLLVSAYYTPTQRWVVLVF